MCSSDLIETNREQRQKDYKANKETEKNNKREYVRLCLFGLFDVGADDELNFGRAFLQIIQGKIEKIADAQEYKPPPKNRRDKTTLPKNADGSDSNTSKTVEKYMAEVSGQESGLNLLYGRAKFASRAIKSILQAKNTRNAIDGYKPAPNLIFSLRSYDRSTPRSEREIDGNNPFNGYMHNTSFALPAGQRWHIKKYLESLLRLGPDSYDSERYGADDWASLTNDYKNFARTLDRWFWYILRTKDGVDTLLNVMSSRVGSTATSFVDPVFYYGSALYRMPFRKQGGLDRLYGLQDIYEALPSEEKMKFGFRHVTKRRINKLGFSWDERKIEELQRDCLRVVTFFYITRMLGPDITSKGEYWTKILLFPLDVSGAVVGTLGCISFERKTQHVGQKLPSERTFWNQEFYFFSEIFSSSQQFLRQQYRNFQIKHICDAYRASLLGLVVEAFENKNKTPPPESLANLVDALNSETEILARVCPYPRYKFQLKVALQSSEMPEKVSASDKDAFREYLRKLQSMTFSVRPEDADNNDTEWSIRIGTRLRLVFSWDRANDIFRAHHSLPGLGLVHEENLQLLQSKLSETTKIVLERAAELITANKK